MIQEGQHLNTDKIVAIDVEYGGGRTVPRIAIVNFDEEVLYYSDFCLRYEDWVETKLTEGQDGVSDQPEPLMMYSEKATTAEMASNMAEKEMNEIKGDGNETMEDCEGPDDPVDSDDEDLQREIAEFERKCRSPEFYGDFERESQVSTVRLNNPAGIQGPIANS